MDSRVLTGWWKPGGRTKAAAGGDFVARDKWLVGEIPETGWCHHTGPSSQMGLDQSSHFPAKATEDLGYWVEAEAPLPLSTEGPLLLREGQKKVRKWNIYVGSHPQRLYL